MSFDWASCAERQRTGSSRMKSVLVALASRADAAGYCWPSHRDLAERTELSPKTVRRALEDLEVDGFISSRRRFVEGRQTSNDYRLHLDWSVMARPPLLDDDGNAEGSEGGHRDQGEVVTVTRGGGHRDHQNQSMNQSEEARTTRRRSAASRNDRQPVRRVRGEDHGDDDAPALGADPRRKTTAERDEVAAERGTSGRGLALRLQRALEHRTDELGSVDVAVVGKQLNDRARRGQSRELQAKMVEVFAAAPERYTRGDQKGTWAFINALAKLEADAGKHRRATASAAELYGDDAYANEVDD